MERPSFGWQAALVGAVLLFGLFIWPTPWSYHYERSGNFVVRLNRFTGYAQRVPIHEAVKPQKPPEDDQLDRLLGRFRTLSGGDLRDIEQDPDFQALLPLEQEDVRLSFLRQFVLTSADFRSLSPQEKSRIALRVMAVREGPGLAELFLRSVREAPVRWKSEP